MNKIFPKSTHTISVKTCERLLDNLTSRYTDEEIRSKSDSIMSSKGGMFDDCMKILINSTLDDEDTSSFE